MLLEKHRESKALILKKYERLAEIGLPPGTVQTMFEFIDLKHVEVTLDALMPPAMPRPSATKIQPMKQQLFLSWLAGAAITLGASQAHAEQDIHVFLSESGVNFIENNAAVVVKELGIPESKLQVSRIISAIGHAASSP